MAISGAIGNIATDCRHPASPNTAHDGPPRSDVRRVRGHPGAPGGHPWSLAIITAALSGLILVNMSGSQSGQREGKGDTMMYYCTTRGTELYIVSQTTGPL